MDADATIAERILGPGAQREPIAATKNEVSRWSARDRSIVIKRSPERQNQREVTEAAIYARIAGLDIGPAVLESTPDFLVLEFIDAPAAIDVIDPTCAMEHLQYFERFVTVMAQFHDAVAGCGVTLAAKSQIPGPTGVVHGDALPHNILISPENRVVLIDFDDAGSGPLYLDLVGMLCVLPLDKALALTATYHQVRGIAAQMDAMREILTAYPRLRLARLRCQRTIFRDDAARFDRILAWLEQGVLRGTGL